VNSVDCWTQRNQSEYQALKKCEFTPYLFQRGRFIARVNFNELLQTYKEAGELCVSPGDSDWV
jgi:hypothetical protein